MDDEPETVVQPCRRWGPLSAASGRGRSALDPSEGVAAGAGRSRGCSTDAIAQGGLGEPLGIAAGAQCLRAAHARGDHVLGQLGAQGDLLSPPPWLISRVVTAWCRARQVNPNGNTGCLSSSGVFCRHRASHYSSRRAARLARGRDAATLIRVVGGRPGEEAPPPSTRKPPREGQCRARR